MKTSNTILASAATLMALITSSFAGEVSGTVAVVDPEQRTLTLETGEVFTLADEVSLEGIQPGVNVMVTFDDATTEATAIEPVG